MSIQQPQHWYEWYPYIILHHYADFKGCAARPEYWYSVLLGILIGLGADALFALSYHTVLHPLIHAALLLFDLAVLCPTIAVLVRRLHDVNKSAWYILLELIPILGWIWLLFILAQPGVMDGNRYCDSRIGGEA
ncbi:DUF805 domain-containing protein [Acidithiobacillus sp. MC6.1]|nr:DUF805 domain-containing protein [Acidithiobacillus sp. MC6.1]